MEIYLIRHAIAEERGDDWPDDDDRPLTEEGIRRFEEAARGLLEFDAHPVRILTSPLVRARQTAELLAAATHPPQAGGRNGQSWRRVTHPRPF